MSTSPEIDGTSGDLFIVYYPGGVTLPEGATILFPPGYIEPTNNGIGFVSAATEDAARLLCSDPQRVDVVGPFASKELALRQLSAK
jgi:hypothetical protein